MPSTTRFRVLGVAGSTRGQSYSTRALKAALAHAEKLGAETRLLELGNAGIPFYNPEAPSSKELQDASASISWADAIILASPDYHGSMSGTLKNFLDHFWQEFAGKLFVTIVSSHEKGLTVTDQLRTVARQCYAWSLPYGLSFVDKEDLLDGKVHSDSFKRRLEMMVHDAIAYGRVLSSQRRRDLECSDPGFMARYRKKA